MTWEEFCCLWAVSDENLGLGSQVALYNLPHIYALY